MLDLVDQLEIIQDRFNAGQLNGDHFPDPEVEVDRHGFTRIIKTGYEFDRDDHWDLTRE